MLSHMVGGFILFVLVVVAFVSGVFYLLEYHPQSFPIALVIKHRDIAGPVLATGIAIIAAGVAFLSVQMQIGVQRRSTQISELTFWQTERNTAEVTIEGLGIVKQAADAVAAAFEKKDGSTPYLTGLISLQPSGWLDMSQWPPTGRSLINWEMNRQISVLRILYLRLSNSTDDAIRKSGEEEIKTAVDRIISVRQQLGELIEAAKRDRDRAQRILKDLDASS
jgi:hypothetical protein